MQAVEACADEAERAGGSPAAVHHDLLSVPVTHVDETLQGGQAKRSNRSTPRSGPFGSEINCR